MSEFVQAVGTLVAAHTLLLDLVKPPLRKWPGGTSHSPTKTTQTPFQPYSPPLLSLFLPLVKVESLVWTRRGSGADVCPVRPLGTCRAPAHLLLKSPFTPTNLPPPALPSLSLPSPPTPLTPSSPTSPPCPPAQMCCSRVRAGRLSRRDPFTTRPPHTDCRLPPAGIGAPPSPLSSNWPEWPVWPAGATTHTGRLVMLLMETVFTGSADRYVAPINAADRNLQFQAATEKEEWHHPHLTTD